MVKQNELTEYQALKIDSENSLKIQQIAEEVQNRCYTKIIAQSNDKLEFEWHINEEMLHKYYYTFFRQRDKCHCTSDIVCHEYSQTKWVAVFHPMGRSISKNFKNNEALINLCLMNKASNIDTTKINCDVLCKQIQRSVKIINLTAAQVCISFCDLHVNF